MDEWLARLLMVIEGVSIVCLTAFAAYWMRLRHQRRMLADQREIEQLRTEVDDLRSLTQAQVHELQERLDFADRLLSRQRTAVDPVERIPTPV